jgi:hypothetical protein
MSAPRPRPLSDLRRAQFRVETARRTGQRAYDALLAARERLDGVVEQAVREQSFVPLAGLFARVEARAVRFRAAMIAVRTAEDGVRKIAEAMSARIG